MVEYSPQLRASEERATTVTLVTCRDDHLTRRCQVDCMGKRVGDCSVGV